jgi:hypothetical protein
MMHGPLTITQAERARQIDGDHGERIIRIVDTWPPLTEGQLAQLAVLLAP